MLMRCLRLLVTVRLLKPWNQTGYCLLHPVVHWFSCSTCFLSQQPQKTQPCKDMISAKGMYHNSMLQL